MTSNFPNLINYKEVSNVAGSDAGNKLWLSWLQRQMQEKGSFSVLVGERMFGWL